MWLETHSAKETREKKERGPGWGKGEGGLANGVEISNIGRVFIK